MGGKFIMGTTFIPVVFFIIYFFIKVFDMREYEKKTEKKIED